MIYNARNDQCEQVRINRKPVTTNRVLQSQSRLMSPLTGHLPFPWKPRSCRLCAVLYPGAFAQNRILTKNQTKRTKNANSRLFMLLLFGHGCAWLLYCKTDHDCAYGFHA